MVQICLGEENDIITLKWPTTYKIRLKPESINCIILSLLPGAIGIVLSSKASFEMQKEHHNTSSVSFQSQYDNLSHIPGAPNTPSSFILLPWYFTRKIYLPGLIKLRLWTSLWLLRWQTVQHDGKGRYVELIRCVPSSWPCRVQSLKSLVPINTHN